MTPQKLGDLRKVFSKLRDDTIHFARSQQDPVDLGLRQVQLLEHDLL